MAIYFYTKDSAQAVANIVAASREHPNEYFPLSTVIFREQAEVIQPVLYVREMRRTNELSNGTEIVYCVNNGGRHVEILFPRPTEREFWPAEVLIEGVN